MKFNIRTKLLLAFGLVILLSGAVNIYSIIQMNELAGLTTKIYNHPLQVTRAVLNADVNIIKMHRSMKDMALATNADEIEAARQIVDQCEQKVYEHFSIIQKWILGYEGAKLISKTIDTFRQWSPIREEVIALMQAGHKDKAAVITKEKGAKHVALLDSQMVTLIDYAANKATGMYNNAQSTRLQVVETASIALIIVVILGALLAWFIAHGAIKSVQIIKAIASKLVAGEISSAVNNQAEMNKIISVGGEMGEIGLAFYIVADSFKNVMDDIVDVSQGLAKGDLQIMPKATYPGDLSQIKDALEIALPNLRQMVQDITNVSQGLATGNLHVTPQVEYEGDFVQLKNGLENALFNLLHVVEDIVQVSQKLAKGEQVTTQAEYQGDFLKIKEALETASVTLGEATTENNKQNWLKTGQTQLSEQMSGEQDLISLSKKVITFIASYLEIQVGMFYLFEEAKGEKKAHLKMIASYAYTQRKGINSEIQLGQGIVGQAALEQKTILITQVPDDYYARIQSGLGNALPRNVLVQPFMYENTLVGMIEIASFKTLTELKLEFLTQIMPSIAIAVKTAMSRTQMRVLLEETQQQAEELQSQSEELQSQQEELRQSNEELEEHSQELQQQQDQIRKKNTALVENQLEMEKARAAIELKAEELELASKYKSEFLANMSHELRTPLNSLLILAQLLAENPRKHLDEKEEKYANTIYSAGSDLLTLINEILDLSKVEAGKIEVHVEEVSVVGLIETIQQKFQHLADQKGLAFPVTIADSIPQVLHTDGQRLKQVINNMLSNAFKFTTEGEVKLVVQRPTGNEDIFQNGNGKLLDVNKTIAISVIDNGIGIPEDKHDVIFEAFQQADGSTSRRYGGTGLGLSISRQLAIFLGGDLVLQSEYGHGSTFTFYLSENLDTQKYETEEIPVVEAVSDETVIESTAPKEIMVDDDRDNLSPDDKSLLLIEDDKTFVNILKDLAHDNQFKCLIAEDGASGLQLADEYHPNAIILDVGLPQIDGLTLMERLKANPETRHIPVHFISGSENSLDAKQMGAKSYLRKPVNMEQLGETFKEIEQFLAKTMKNLLVVVDNQSHQQKIVDISGSGKVETTIAVTVAEALEQLKNTAFDCLILDIDLEQATGIKLLEQIPQDQEFQLPPVIIYAERDLTESEEVLLQQRKQDITLKTVRSPERLLDEATLFLHQIQANLPEDKQQMLEKVHDKEAILKGKEVLIVDDDVRNTFALVTALEGHKLEVLVAATGVEALSVLDEHPDINIVLMDIMMPEMDGYEAMQKIREQARFRQLPIIALTAKAMKKDRAKCIEAGANDYLSKPIDLNKLLSLMRVWLYR